MFKIMANNSVSRNIIVVNKYSTVEVQPDYRVSRLMSKYSLWGYGHPNWFGDDMNAQGFANFIWSVTNILRGDYKQASYGQITMKIYLGRSFPI